MPARSAGESSRRSSASDSALAVAELTFAYGSAPRGRHAIADVSFRVDGGSTLAIVGPSGAGKSTLLRAIAGLLEPVHGDVTLDGTSMRAWPACSRRIALVFQDDALVRTMSVRENLRFAMRDGTDATRLIDVARALRVDAHLDRMPRDLSGGERQRVALARALLSSPRALLLDEPLAHLDPALRAHVRDMLREMRAHFFGPVVYVTHDHVEAMVLGDTLGVLVDGRLEDIGPPRRVYDAPANVRAAAALGVPSMNLFADGPHIAGIRPEHVRIVEDAPLRGRVERAEVAADLALLWVLTERGTLSVRCPSSEARAVGDEVALALPPERVRRFDAASGAAIG